MDQDNLNENIIARLGLESLPESDRLKFLERATELVQKRIILRLMENLAEEDVAEANRLAGKPDELLAFLASKTDDFAAALDEEIDAVKDELAINLTPPETEA
jgi:hypothetical protein